MDLYEESVRMHVQHKGKIAIAGKVPVNTRLDLSLAYTPGVAEPCRRIAKDKKLIYDYTFKGNTVAVVTDGSAVLGLGNIGPEAALPVMEGKALLMKEFGNLDAFPICLTTQKTEEIIQAVEWLATVFGGINLEDISAPRCFEVEDALKEKLDIPVFHDDQHGTAIVVMAALVNACRLAGKELGDLKVVVCGAGAAGIAISRMLLCIGMDKKVCRPVGDIIICDSRGIVHNGRDDLNSYKKDMAKLTNRSRKTGGIGDALDGADVLIGVSAAGIVKPEMIAKMRKSPIILAMANPVPEIMPEDVRKARPDAIIGTGRSDYPNQVNNVLAFPGIFRGAFDAKATRITDQMKLAAAYALADYVVKPARDNILPDPLDKKVALAVAKAVGRAAVDGGFVRA
ncbi:MAG: NADP-dependent malic enzyme [Candidatus Altiarchaeota archaeon]|nr:NADP-dependent malic enzyme [Candidatus Altiarchaeota archaeon]